VVQLRHLGAAVPRIITYRVEQPVEDIPDFWELCRRLLCALLPHHGEQVQDSPAQSKSLEELCLHLLDMLDARIRGS